MEVRILILIPPFLVTIVNVLLTRTIKYFTSLIKFDTTTAYHSAVAIRITIALFINTAIISFIVYRNDYYGKTSLITEIMLIIFISAAI